MPRLTISKQALGGSLKVDLLDRSLSLRTRLESTALSSRVGKNAGSEHIVYHAVSRLHLSRKGTTQIPLQVGQESFGNDLTESHSLRERMGALLYVSKGCKDYSDVNVVCGPRQVPRKGVRKKGRE